MSADPLAQQANVFIAKLGHRMLAARRQRSLSRRELAEISGVSPRTIALLETGVGNISIALLYRLCKALGYSLEQMLASERQVSDGDTSNAMASDEFNRLSMLFWAAKPQQRQRALEQLAAEPIATDLKQNRICLIGLRGAGKSTLGAMLAKSLQWDFVELNYEIEELCGMPVQELINLYGQDGYRELEKQALAKVVAASDRLVLAAAGGVVSETKTYAYVQAHFHTIWLKAKPEEHMQRVRKQGDERPMAGNPLAMQELKSILTRREVLYANADDMINTSEQNLQQTSQQLLTAVQRMLNVK